MGLMMVPPARALLLDWPTALLSHAILSLFGVSLGVAATAAPKPDEAPPPLDPLAYNVALPAVQFEGPLDLLLHLIQSHRLNILDIPMRFITERYLEYLTAMQTVSLDLASEYLVMAAVLTHIKSKMLLPELPSADDNLPEEELDPREELVRRLLEYQRFKAASVELGVLGAQAQDAFCRPPTPPPPRHTGPLAPLSMFQLLEAFTNLLTRRKVKIGHEITFDRLTITDRINELIVVLGQRRHTTFEALFEDDFSRFDLVITFLALLEMSKLRLTRLFQTNPYAPLHIEYLVTEATLADADLGDEIQVELDFDDPPAGRDS
jgi:segregation and condensation protein A